MEKSELAKLAKQLPNDQDLGSAVRTLAQTERTPDLCCGIYEEEEMFIGAMHPEDTKRLKNI